jgi:Sec-independent protein secretion pathway component TatC
MHAVVTGLAAALPLVLVALMVLGTISKDIRTQVICWIAAIAVFGITVAIANVYASQHGGAGMWWWYGITAVVTIFVVMPCVASEDDNTKKSSTNSI